MDAIRARTMTTVQIRISLLEERFVQAISTIVTGGAVAVGGDEKRLIKNRASGLLRLRKLA
jgi:hypothetical protein